MFVVQAEELFLWVPRKMLMTVQSAQSSALGEEPLSLKFHGNIWFSFVFR